MRDICWEIDYHETFRGIIKLFEAVRVNGMADVKDAPDNFTRRCPHIKELIAIVNCLFDLYCRTNYWQQQRISSRNLISAQLQGVSEVLEKIAKEAVDFGEEREILERELQRAVAKRGNEESFVTLDLCVVDLYSGIANFIKTGAATSYIKRGTAVKTVKGSSLPVGVLYHVEKEVISEQLLPGDMVILASDGLLDMDMDDEGQWLARVIEQAAVNNPQSMAEYLLDKVISISNGKIKDDITFVVAQVGDVA